MPSPVRWARTLRAVFCGRLALLTAHEGRLTPAGSGVAAALGCERYCSRPCERGREPGEHRQVGVELRAFKPADA